MPWALAGALLLLAPFLAHNGIPAYIHDWSWPPDQAGLRAMTARALSAWVPDGLGAPNAFPSILPQFYFEWLLSWVLPSKAVLDLVLFLTFAAGIGGAAFAARTLLGIDNRWAVFCGFFYLAGPITISKFVAGHTSYLEGYAALPFFLALALRQNIGNRRLWIILSALALAFTIVQLQIFGLALIVLIFAVIFRKRTLKEAATIVLIALPLLLPALLGPLFLSQPSHGAIAMQRAVLSWQLQQSVPPIEATEGRGYFVHYYELLTQFWLQHVLLLFPLCALFALIELRREMRVAGLLVALALLAWLTATGLRGPLHELWSVLFARIPAFSVYRELYDVMALYWLVVVLLAARFWMTQRAVGWLFAIFGLWATLPAWFAAPNLVGWAPTPATIGVLTTAAQRLPPGRVLWWPAQQPLGPPDRTVGGADPLAYTPLGRARPIFEYQPYGSFAAAVTLAQQGNWQSAEPIFSQLGIVAIADRRTLATFASGRPELARSVPEDAATTLLADRDGVRLFALANAQPIVALQQSAAFTELPHAFVHSVAESAPAPGRLIAAYPYYWATPAIGFCGQASVLGYSNDLAAAQRPWYFVATFNSIAGCRWLPRAAVARFPKDRLLVAGGWFERPLATAAPIEAAPSGSVVITHAKSDEIEGDVHSDRGGVLVLRNDFDRRWKLIDGDRTTASRLVEGFANGWTLPPGNRHFVLWFSPAGYLRAALAAGFLWMILLVGELIRMLNAHNRAAAQ